MSRTFLLFQRQYAPASLRRCSSSLYTAEPGHIELKGDRESVQCIDKQKCKICLSEADLKTVHILVSFYSVKCAKIADFFSEGHAKVGKIYLLLVFQPHLPLECIHMTGRFYVFLKKCGSSFSDNERPQVVCFTAHKFSAPLVPFTALHCYAVVKLTRANLSLWSVNRNPTAGATDIFLDKHLAHFPPRLALPFIFNASAKAASFCRYEDFL